jgi:hypothetical protein
MKFVPDELKNENIPCRFIPLTEKGETIDYFYRCGTQLEMEEALADWLRSQITRIEQQLAKSIGPLPEECDELSKVAETKQVACQFEQGLLEHGALRS